MSLGFISQNGPSQKNLKTTQTNSSFGGNEQVKIKQIHVLNKTRLVNIYYYINTLLTVVLIVGILTVGLYFIPNEYIVNFDNYGQSFTVLDAMHKRFVDNTFVTIAGWIFPIVPAIFIPLYATEILSLLSITLGCISLGSLLSFSEREHFIDLLENTPEMGYMWHEMINISLCTFLNKPNSFFTILLGPAACITTQTFDSHGKYRYKYILFIIIAISSIVLVLPTVSVFIDDEGEFFLLGYSTKSIYGTLLSYSMIIVWVRTYHLICRDVYQLFKTYSSKCVRIIAVIWSLLGTGLVLLWVSSAFALHIAIVYYFKLKSEKSLLDFEFSKKIKNMCHV